MKALVGLVLGGIWEHRNVHEVESEIKSLLEGNFDIEGCVVTLRREDKLDAEPDDGEKADCEDESDADPEGDGARDWTFLYESGLRVTVAEVLKSEQIKPDVAGLFCRHGKRVSVYGPWLAVTSVPTKKDE